MTDWNRPMGRVTASGWLLGRLRWPSGGGGLLSAHGGEFARPIEGIGRWTTGRTLGMIGVAGG